MSKRTNAKFLTAKGRFKQCENIGKMLSLYESFQTCYDTTNNDHVNQKVDRIRSHLRSAYREYLKRRIK